MLKLKELYALPMAPPPEITLEPSHTVEYNRWDGFTYTTTILHRKYTARTVTVGEQLLETTAYSYDNIPLWRTWQTQDRVAGQKLCSPPKPIKATVGYLTAHDTPGDFFTDAASEAAAMTWIKKYNYPLPAAGSYADGHQLSDTLDFIGYSQMAARHKKRDDERDRIRREIDNDMLEIREPPKAFRERILHDGFAAFHYIIYRYKPKKDKLGGYCTRCCHEVTVTKPRNRNAGICPRCHSPITFLSAGTLNSCTKISHNRTVAYLQSTRAGFCARVFSATMVFDRETFYEPEIQMYEQSRHFYSFAVCDFTKYFIWGEPWPNERNSWCRSSNYQDTNEGYLYPDNLTDLFQKSPWRYIPMAGIARNIPDLQIKEMIQQSRVDLAIEHLAKHELWKLVGNRIDHQQMGWGCYWESSTNARDIKQALGGLNRNDVRILQQINPSTLQLSLYRTLRDMGMATLENIQACIDCKFETIAACLKEMLGHTTLHRILRYCREQVPNTPKENRFNEVTRTSRPAPCSAHTILKDWQDYLHDAQRLGWDITSDFVLFPANLQEAHKQSIDAIAQAKDKQKYQMLLGTISQYAYLEYKSGKLLIRLPRNGPEIQAEGKALHHCVGRYVDRVARGETLIFFIRKEDMPEEPFYTLELNPKTMNVVQVRGAYNCAATVAVNQFLAKWKSYLTTAQAERPRKRQRVRIAG